MNEREMQKQIESLQRRLAAAERRLAGIPQRFCRGGGLGAAAVDTTLGTLTGQVRQMVSDNAAAWQFPVAHAIE